MAAHCWCQTLFSLASPLASEKCHKCDQCMGESVIPTKHAGIPDKTSLQLFPVHPHRAKQGEPCAQNRPGTVLRQGMHSDFKCHLPERLPKVLCAAPTFLPPPWERAFPSLPQPWRRQTPPFLKQLFMPMACRQLEQGRAFHSQETKGQMFPYPLMHMKTSAFYTHW